jgi:hypothetical protein
MIKKPPTVTISTWSVTNARPARYLVAKSRARPSGLERYRSIDPPVIRSGKIPAVEISARIVAAQVS